MYLAILGCTGLYWAVLGCTGMYWTALEHNLVELNCSGLRKEKKKERHASEAQTEEVESGK